MLELALSNALVATVLAGVASVICIRRHHPVLMHAAWLLVFIKLLTPPVFFVPVPFFGHLADGASATEDLTAPTGDSTASIADTDRGALPAEFQNRPLEVDSKSLTPQVHNRTVAGAEDSQPNAPRQSTAVFSETNPTAAAEPHYWSNSYLRNTVAVVWLAGAFIWFALAVSRARRIHRLIALARPASGELREELERIARQFQLTRCPEAHVVTGGISPMVWAVGRRPRILLPSALLERLDSDERHTVLAHELAHVKRRDSWVRLAEFVASGLYWWFPVVWWARVQLRRAEEECCDAWVTSALPGSSHAYANALLKTLELLNEPPHPRPVLHPFGSGGGDISIPGKETDNDLPPRKTVAPGTSGISHVDSAVGSIAARCARPSDRRNSRRLPESRGRRGLRNPSLRPPTKPWLNLLMPSTRRRFACLTRSTRSSR